MKVNVEQQDKNTVKLNIEIDSDKAAQEYNKACKRLAQHVSISGFRKGKAPQHIVEKYVGKERIKREAMDRVLPSVLADTISENKYDLATEPIIEKFDFELGKSLNIDVKLELKPEVTLNEYKGLTVDVEKFENEENAIEKELETLANRFSTLEPITGRVSTDKDVVIIDFNGSIDGEAIKGGSAKNYNLDLGNSNFIPGFAEQIVGKNIAEEFDINVTFPENYQDEKTAGKEAVFKIKLNEIKEKITPEIDDELAKKVSPFPTIDELKKDIQGYLDKRVDTENDNKAEKAILDKVIENSDVEIPDSMVNKEAKLLLSELENRLKSQGANWEEFLNTEGQEKIWENLRGDATNRVKNSLVLGAIAKQEDIQLSDEDFNVHVKELAAAYNTNEKEVYKQISQSPEFAQMFTQQIMGQKIIKFLKDNNKVKFVEPVKA